MILNKQESQGRNKVIHWLSFGLWTVTLLVIAPSLLSPFDLNLLGKFLAYAIVALGLALIWGYTGMLSLGQGLFFGLGAYSVANSRISWAFTESQSYLPSGSRFTRPYLQSVLQFWCRWLSLRF